MQPPNQTSDASGGTGHTGGNVAGKGATDKRSVEVATGGTIRDEIVILGRVIGFYGLRGWVKVHSDTQPRENIVDYRSWLLGDGADKLSVTVTNGKRVGKNVVAKIAGVDSREEAAKLLGLTISIPRSALPEPEPGEVYWTDIVGCRVLDLSGQLVGTASRLFETGANDVLVVRDERQPDGNLAGSMARGTDSSVGSGVRSNPDKIGQEILIPWLRPEVITSVDLVQKTITVDWDPDF